MVAVPCKISASHCWCCLMLMLLHCSLYFWHWRFETSPVVDIISIFLEFWLSEYRKNIDSTTKGRRCWEWRVLSLLSPHPAYTSIWVPARRLITETYFLGDRMGKISRIVKIGEIWQNVAAKPHVTTIKSDKLTKLSCRCSTTSSKRCFFLNASRKLYRTLVGIRS